MNGGRKPSMGCLVMFGWFNRGRQDQARLAHAYEMGQRAAQHFADDLDKLMAARFNPVFENYLSAVQRQFNACLNATDAPPIISARMDYKIFLEYVDKLQDQMEREITTTLSEWLDVADQLQSREKFTELIQVKVQDFCVRLKETGLQRLIDMAHALKLADDDWRRENPELSSRLPPDTL